MPGSEATTDRLLEDNIGTNLVRLPVNKGCCVDDDQVPSPGNQNSDVDTFN